LHQAAFLQFERFQLGFEQANFPGASVQDGRNAFLFFKRRQFDGNAEEILLAEHAIPARAAGRCQAHLENESLLPDDMTEVTGKADAGFKDEGWEAM
jgi:hypothetical protein